MRLGVRFSMPGRRRGLSAVLLAALLLACAAPAVAQEGLSRDDAAKQLEEKQRALETARDKENSITQDIDTLDQESAQLNEQLIETARRIQTSEARLSEIEVRLQDLSIQQTSIRDSIAQRHDTIAKLLAAMQRLGGQPPPAIITRRDDVLKMVRSAMLMAALYPELKEQAESLSSDLDNLMRLQTEMASESTHLKEESNRLAGQQMQVKTLLAEKKRRMAERQVELAEVRKAAAQYGKTVTYLSDLVLRMDKELADRMAKYEAELAADKARAEEAAKGKVVELAPKAEKVAFVSPGRIKPAVPFDKAKGALRLPVRGKPVRGFGDADGFGGTSKGMSLQTRPGGQVTSPTDGWVVYADEFRGYGQLLIINAGGGYHVLLAGMRQIDVSLGQFVLAGEPVAVMGAEASEKRQGPQQARPVLYIEFRKDGQPIDPDPWWAESPEKVQG